MYTSWQTILYCLPARLRPWSGCEVYHPIQSSTINTTFRLINMCWHQSIIRDGIVHTPRTLLHSDWPNHIHTHIIPKRFYLCSVNYVPSIFYVENRGELCLSTAIACSVLQNYFFHLLSTSWATGLIPLLLIIITWTQLVGCAQQIPMHNSTERIS